MRVILRIASNGTSEEDTMTDEQPVAQDMQISPDALKELREILVKQNEMIQKQNAAISSLESRLNDSEKMAAAAPAKQEAAAEPEISPQDAAYAAMLREMGIKE